jgi:hypothetical protein
MKMKLNSKQAGTSLFEAVAVVALMTAISGIAIAGTKKVTDDYTSFIKERQAAERRAIDEVLGIHTNKTTQVIGKGSI